MQNRTIGQELLQFLGVWLADPTQSTVPETLRKTDDQGRIISNPIAQPGEF